MCRQEEVPAAEREVAQRVPRAEYTSSLGSRPQGSSAVLRWHLTLPGGVSRQEEVPAAEREVDQLNVKLQEQLAEAEQLQNERDDKDARVKVCALHFGSSLTATALALYNLCSVPLLLLSVWQVVLQSCSALAGRPDHTRPLLLVGCRCAAEPPAMVPLALRELHKLICLHAGG